MDRIEGNSSTTGGGTAPVFSPISFEISMQTTKPYQTNVAGESKVFMLTSLMLGANGKAIVVGRDLSEMDTHRGSIETTCPVKPI